MKKLIPLLLASICATANAETPVTVTINNVTSDTGELVLSVYDSKKTWLKKPVAQEVRDAEDSVDIEIALPAGDYAFQVFHDLDGNGKMKTNFIGIPKEPTGVSNNAKGRFGPPKFKDAAVTVSAEPVSVVLTLVSID